MVRNEVSMTIDKQQCGADGTLNEDKICQEKIVLDTVSKLDK